MRPTEATDTFGDAIDDYDRKDAALNCQSRTGSANRSVASRDGRASAQSDPLTCAEDIDLIDEPARAELSEPVESGESDARFPRRDR